MVDPDRIRQFLPYLTLSGRDLTGGDAIAERSAQVRDDIRALLEAVEESERAQHILCGMSHPDPDVERRFAAVRRERGERTDGGCGKAMHWTLGYRCLECGRWLHAGCMRTHFAEPAEATADGAGLGEEVPTAGQPAVASGA